MFQSVLDLTRGSLLHQFAFEEVVSIAQVSCHSQAAKLYMRNNLLP